MIVRIMGEGQFNVADVDSETLQKFDNQVEAAMESGDDDKVVAALEQLRAFIVEHGEEVPADFLGASDFVIPYADAHLDEIKELLTGEGFVPDVI